MPIVHDLANFVDTATYDDLSDEAKKQLKVRVLDSLGCAIGALDGGPIRALREHLADFGGAEHATLVGGGRTAPDRAALYNSALVRYLDYNDSYLAEGETGHPSDNLGSVLAATEYAGGSGEDLLTALAVAYQVQCRLSDEAPVRAKGFDHTVQGQYAAAAGAAKALGLDPEQIANAIAISGTAHNALRVTRTGEISNWKGLAYPETGFTATHSAFLAMRGITGPPEVFEGNKGFKHSIAGDFALDWSEEDLERVTGTIIKKYNAEIHSQATLEGALELKRTHGIDPSTIDEIEVDTFDVAFHIIGGGEEGDKTIVRRKEEADHSLHYMTAVALLDDQVLPAQYEQDRIEAGDVQSLLRKVHVTENPQYSDRFPDHMVCDVRIHADGQVYEMHKEDYEGFHTKPMTWDTVSEKFARLAEPYTDAALRQDLIDAVQELETFPAGDLFDLLSRVQTPEM
ncbi:MmgE/PrpD family protein [Salinibacter altiplanensis]|uniref:MmgE/PrpD family protein n=1 Tax=Salinibacter altiplanensis TaxID=1803181 RepID=UPI000C9EFA81|nr:MmgE/PrpD family protein [Salinibacter altiplanensis]